MKKRDLPKKEPSESRLSPESAAYLAAKRAGGADAEAEPREIVRVYRDETESDTIEISYQYRLSSSLKERLGLAGPVRRSKSLRRRRRGDRFFNVIYGIVGILLIIFLCVSIGSFVKPHFSFRVTLPGQTIGESSNISMARYTVPEGGGPRFRLADTRGEPLGGAEIYRRVSPAVVSVSVRSGSTLYTGTGVIITADGYIITNYHVIEGGEECSVLLSNDASYEAAYVAGDADLDLAVLKIDGTGLPTAVLGDSDLMAVGESAYAIGSPLGLRLRGSMTDGIISYIGRDMEVDGRSMTLLQTTAALNNGNSGGPLLNDCGQVIGINVIKMVSSQRQLEGLGFAIPTTTVERTVNDLIRYGATQPEPLYGLYIGTVSEQQGEHEGLRIYGVTPGGAAERAGLKTDDLLLTLDGEAMHSERDLLRVRRQMHIGDTLAVTVLRGDHVLGAAFTFTEADIAQP